MAIALEERTSDLDELLTLRASVLLLAQRFDPAGLRPVELTQASWPPRSPATPSATCTSTRVDRAGDHDDRGRSTAA